MIGNICACLPSLNILIETLTAQRDSANVPRSRLFVKWLRHSIRSVTVSSLSFDFWSKSNLDSKPCRGDDKSSRTQEAMLSTKRKDEVDHPPEIDCCQLDRTNLSLPRPAAYRLPSLSFTACGFAELGQARSVRTSMTKDEIRTFEKREHDEDDFPPQNGSSRKARSWDGVMSDRVDDWNPAGLGTLESIHNRTTVRIKWLGSASH